MTKKFFAALTVILMSVAAFAQTAPNRMVVNMKAGTLKSYRTQSVDNVSFATVEGEVKAVVEFKKYTTGNTGDTIWCAVQKTPACKMYHIDVLPTSVATSLSEDDLARYFDAKNDPTVTDDFTNAAMTGFETEMSPGTNYTLFTLGYDELGTPCEMSKVTFATPAADIKGNPKVEAAVTDATHTSLTFNFKPNNDVLNYYICIFKKGKCEEEFNTWASMFGFANIGEMIQTFSQNGYKGEQTQTLTSLTPGTDYELYIQPTDKNGNFADMVVLPCATLKMGGDGKSVMSIDIKEFQDRGNDVYTQRVVYTPNDQTGLHRDMIIDKNTFTTSADWGNGSEQAIIDYLKAPNEWDPYWDQYGVDDVEWTVSPATTYIAFTIGQNANGEWGELVKKEFTTPSAANAPALRAADGTALRFGTTTPDRKGMTPMKKTKRILVIE